MEKNEIKNDEVDKKATRMFFIDHMRAFLCILVVLHHLALIYGGLGLYYYIDLPAPTSQEFTGMFMFMFFNQAWFMGAFFLLAGYFTPRALDRKGESFFLKARLLRLGIPTILFFFVIGPITSFGVYTMPASVTGPLPPAWLWYFLMMGIGPMWFCVLLLIFSFGYAAFRRLTKNRTSSSTSKSTLPSYILIGIFILVLALSNYLIRVIIPIGVSVALIPPGYEGYIVFPTFSYLPQYLSFFVLGTIACRRDWFRNLPNSKGVVGFVIAAVASILLFPLAFSGQWFSLEANFMFLGYGHWQSAIYALWDSFFAVGMSLGTITLFRHFFNEQGKVGKFLSQQGYIVFIIHFPIVMLVSVAITGIPLGKFFKFGIAAVIAVPISFVVAYLIRKIPWPSDLIKPSSNEYDIPDDSISIDVKDLKKNFTMKKGLNDVKAVDGISFDVKKGELFGLLGPNGAGKTTTINMLCGLLKPTEGTIRVGGYDLRKNLNKVKELISICPQKASVFPFLTGKENIEYFGNMHLMSKVKINERAEQLLKFLDLSEAGNRKAKGYSGGMLRQLNLLVALINEPDILFLDEPTVGMDPRVRRKTWEFINSINDQNKTIILTTHYIEEAEALCDRVAIIDYGKIVALDSPKKLMEKHESKNLEEVFLKITGRRILEGV